MFKNNPAIYWLTYLAGIQPALTQTTAAEQDCLVKIATGKKTLVEIGVWHGVNTRRLRNAMANDGVLYAVDPFPKGRFGVRWERQIAHREAAREFNGEVQWLEDYSYNAVNDFKQRCDKPIDFLFIDGDHSFDGVQKDWVLWSPLLSHDGVIALHDSRSYSGRSIDGCGAARFTKEVIHADSRFQLLEETDSLSVFMPRQ